MRCEQLSFFKLPQTLTYLGSGAFMSCWNLMRVNLPDGLMEIQDQVFFMCTKLDYVTIPNTVKRIGNNAFRDCGSMKTIKLPESLESIGDWAFYSCSFSRIEPSTSLGQDNPEDGTCLKLPSSLKHIGKYAFAEIRELTSIILPNSVKTIGELAFSFTRNSHRNLHTLVIPASVEEIGRYAFWHGTTYHYPDEVGPFTDDLNDVYCHLENPVYNNNIFGNVKDKTLHVPAQSIELYRNGSQWNKFKEIVPLTNDEVAMGILPLNGATNTQEVHYSLSGHRIDSGQKGIHIIKYDNGTIRKVVIR